MTKPAEALPQGPGTYALFRITLSLFWSVLGISLRRVFRGPVHPICSWRVEVLADFLRRGVETVDQLPLPEARRRIPVSTVPRHLRNQLTVDASRLAGCLAESITPKTWRTGDPTLLYLHGGGYIACSPASHRELAARIAAAAGARVVSLDYRLAPEHPFPAALDDAVDAYQTLLEEVGPSSLFIAGDSAGGGLALATLLRIRESGAEEAARRQPAGMVLLSPWVDLTLSGESIDANAAACYVQRHTMETYRRHYLGGMDPAQALASPLYADLHGLPPALVQAGSVEALYSEVVLLAEKLEAADVEVTLQVSEGMFHVFQPLASLLPAAEQAVREIGVFIRAKAALRAVS